MEYIEVNQYYIDNRDKIMKRQKEYYERNKPKIADRKKKYYKENKEEINKLTKKSRYDYEQVIRRRLINGILDLVKRIKA